MTYVALREPELIEQVTSIVQREGTTAEQVVRDAVKHYIFAYRREKIRIETESWYAMPQAVRAQYAGKFVAIHKGKIVDSDSEQLVLLKRLRQTFGREPVALLEGGTGSMPTFHSTSIRSAF